MILVKPSYTITAVPENIEQQLEAIGRVCYKSEGRITESSAERFVGNLINRGHESVIEHLSITARFVCDRGVSHELVRHRLASFSQESTRYCDYVKGEIAFIIPPWVDVQQGKYELGHQFEEAVREWCTGLLHAEQSYRALRASGWKPEQARSVLPNALKTEVVMTANLREWRHVLKLRTSPAAHPQMRELMIPLQMQLTAMAPSIFKVL